MERVVEQRTRSPALVCTTIVTFAHIILKRLVGESKKAFRLVHVQSTGKCRV